MPAGGGSSVPTAHVSVWALSSICGAIGALTYDLVTVGVRGKSARKHRQHPPDWRCATPAPSLDRVENSSMACELTHGEGHDRAESSGPGIPEMPRVKPTGCPRPEDARDD
ncbi:hypothetical protein TPA0909_47300 [Streptomyces albus]|nr:hypothetical protein TPA0909_47300 [Streptomyces albus]